MESCFARPNACTLYINFARRFIILNDKEQIIELTHSLVRFVADGRRVASSGSRTETKPAPRHVNSLASAVMLQASRAGPRKGPGRSSAEQIRQRNIARTTAARAAMPRQDCVHMPARFESVFLPPESPRPGHAFHFTMSSIGRVSREFTLRLLGERTVRGGRSRKDCAKLRETL